MWTKDQINGQRERWQAILRKDIGLSEKWRDHELDGILDQAIFAIDDQKDLVEQRKTLDKIKELSK
jgi:hypothetical protein